MTLQQIAINNSLSYSTVYIAMSNAGKLVKRTKNHKYDEEIVLIAVASYLSNRIRKHEKEIAELTKDKNKAMRGLVMGNKSKVCLLDDLDQEIKEEGKKE